MSSLSHHFHLKPCQLLSVLIFSFGGAGVARADDVSKKILATQQAQISDQEARLRKTESELRQGALSWPSPPPSSYETSESAMALVQVLAQATCTAIRGGAGWNFAVQRGTGTKTCAAICEGLSEPQSGPLRCVNALHVYFANGPARSVGAVGLKTYKYERCDDLGFGPNFCCCANR